MNIYSVLKLKDKIKRINLSQQLQTDLKNYINSVIKNFESASQIKFSGEYKPDENQILCIEKFNNPLKDFDAISTEILNENEIESIKTLIFVNKSYIAYQCFDSRKLIRPEKWFLIYLRNTFSKIDKNGLIIDSKIDALYNINEKSLLFYSFHNASKIFDLSHYYREATDEEIESFYKDELFIEKEQIDLNDFNLKIRKKNIFNTKK